MIDKNLMEHRWRAHLSSVPIGAKDLEIPFADQSSMKSYIATAYQMNREKNLPGKFSMSADFDNLKVTLNVLTR